MTRDEAKAIISDLIEWYTEDLGERLGLNMCAETYMDALEVLWHGPEGELIRRADAIAFINSGISLDTDADREYATEMLKNIPSAEAPTTDEKHQLSSETPTNAPTDLISRADAIDAVRVCDVFLAYQGDKIANNIDGFVDSIVEQMRDNISRTVSALPSADAKGDLISRELAMERIANDNVVGGMERINEYNNNTEFNEYLDGISDAITTIFCDVPSADITETETCQRCQESIDTVLNRQGERIKELEASAEATCATCADRALCIMSDDGNWKACKDYRPSAEAVSREGYNETDGVIEIEKQNANEVGEIKHIVIRSPNYTRYFYNESMPTSAEDIHKPDYSYEADMVRRLREYEQGYRQAQAEDVTNGRLIDADALSEKLCETTIFIKDGEVFQRMINDAPTVSAEAVQGEWIRKYDDKINCYWYECDQCGEYRPRNQFGREYNANFCPNCGARMRGEEE